MNGRRRAFGWLGWCGLWPWLAYASAQAPMAVPRAHSQAPVAQLQPLPLPAPPPPDPGPERVEPPRDWDSIGRHARYLLQESDSDFAALRGEQVNDYMWLSRHYIGSPLRGDDPVPPSVIVLQGYTAWFHGTPLAHGNRRQMVNELLSYADEIERAIDGAMDREDIDDTYVRFTACALKSDKYILLSNLPGERAGAEEAAGADAASDGAAAAAGPAGDEDGDYEITLMVGRQPGLC